MKEIKDIKSVLENPLDFIDSENREVIISQIPALYEAIAKKLFEEYDILIWDSKGNEHYYSFAEIEFYYRVFNLMYPTYG